MRKLWHYDPTMPSRTEISEPFTAKSASLTPESNIWKEPLNFNPTIPRHIRISASSYKTQGRYQEAIEHFEKALALQGDRANAITYLNIGDTYFKLSEHDKAIPYFQKAVELNPDHANAHLLLGLSHRALKRGDQATVHFEKTLELEPNHPQAAQIRQWLEPVGERR